MNSARRACCKKFFQEILSLPFQIFLKGLMTGLRVVGVILALSLVIGSFGLSLGIREFFLRRVVSLAQDIVAWIFLPFNVVASLLKLLLGATIRPSIVYN